MWECSKCHEQIDDEFEVCWKCGTAVDGTEDPSFTPGDVYEPRVDAPDAMREDLERLGGPPDNVPLVCAKCGSSDVIPNVRVGDGHRRTDLQVEVYEQPEAIFFRDAQSGFLKAWICGRCGYVDLYVNNPSELLAAYKKSKTSGTD